MYNNLYHQPMTADEIDEMVHRIRDGDTIRLKYILMNNVPLILKILQKYGAEKYDLMHECVPNLLRYIPEYDRTRGRFSTWIERIIRYKLLSLYDKKNAEKRGAKDGEPKLIIHMSVFRQNVLSPRDIMKKKEYKAVRHEAISKAMSALGIRDRFFIREYYMKGRTLYDIAEEDGTSYQNVQQNIRTALRHMRPMIEEYKADLR